MFTTSDIAHASQVNNASATSEQAKKLREELSYLLNRLIQISLAIKCLRQQLSLQESPLEGLELSIEENLQIAEELENAARGRIEVIFEEALAIISNRSQQNKFTDQEIYALIENLKSYLETDLQDGFFNNYSETASCSDNFQFTSPDIVGPTASRSDSMCNETAFESTTYQSENTPLFNSSFPSYSETKYPKPQNVQSLTDKNQIIGSEITMKIVAFLNAKHYMVFNDKKGAVHGHSWHFEAESMILVKDESFLKFEDLDKHLNGLLAPYQKIVLNEIPPFTIVEPLTENIAVVFFNQLYEDLKKLDVNLKRLTVWENPTKGIEITQPMPHYFSSNDSIPLPVAAVEASMQAAAGKEESPPELDNSESSHLTTNRPESKTIQEEQIIEPNDLKINKDLVTEDILHNKAGFLNRLKISWLPRNNPRLDQAIGNMYSYPWWQFLAAAFLISLTAVLIYWPLLNNTSLSNIYPYGSDSWCHLFKAEFLSRQLAKGIFYPSFFSYWDSGVEPFRYWGPLPYMLLAGINLLVNNIFLSSIYYLMALALLGGFSWLVFSRRIGLLPATLGGILWVFWIDNLNVAFSSGNYPRILTIVLLPLLLEFFSRILENRFKYFEFLIIVILIHIIVLSHPLIAAVFCVSLMVFGLIWWLWGGISLWSLTQGFLSLVAGILTSAWWLLPSLTGGGSGFSSEALSANTFFVSFTTSLNPSLRWSEFYWGISLLVLIPMMIFSWRYRSVWAKSLFITGIFMLVLTAPQMRFIHNILPLSSILWPVRFSTFWSIALIISAFSFINKDFLITIGKLRIPLVILAVATFLILSLDSFYSWQTVARTSTVPQSLLSCVESIEKTPGWRVATLDLSRLSSTPSYLLSQVGKREQVFGWAWQGAKTAQNLMLINMALENKWYPYVFDRLSFMGTTDLLVYQDVIKDQKTFRKEAQLAGYQQKLINGGLEHWHSLVVPYIHKNRQQGLAIGKYASIFAMQFPSLEIGSSPNIDAYNINELKHYKTLVLSGASWSSESKAEELVKQYAAGGGRVIVDLTGFPIDLMSRQPKFLGVYGESATLIKQLSISSGTQSNQLAPFDLEEWRCFAPQLLDGSDITFKYYGNDATLFGYKLVYPNVPVYFLGANLGYHAFLTHDPLATKLLQQILQISRDYNTPSTIDLESYTSDAKGCIMTYKTDRELEAILPVAALDGMKVFVDSKPVSSGIYENLVLARLPAGEHRITLEMHQSKVYLYGRWMSFSAILLITFTILLWRYFLKVKSRKQVVLLS